MDEAEQELAEYNSQSAFDEVILSFWLFDLFVTLSKLVDSQSSLADAEDARERPSKMIADGSTRSLRAEVLCQLAPMR